KTRCADFVINKDIMKRLLEKTELSLQRVYQMIDDKRQQYSFAISKETAAYLVAAENTIDISKYLKEDELAKVRELKAVIIPTVKPRPVARDTSSKQIIIEIDKNVKVVDPLLPK